MAKIDKYSISDLKRSFPSESKCLAFLFDARHSRKCSCGGKYRPLTGRKQYQCSKCRFQIAPTAGTIFHKSDTPLRMWFHAIFVFSNAKSGISAKELERQIGVTYKTAWRMLSLIRKALKQSRDKLGGVVEMDEAFFGGVRHSGKDNRGQAAAMANKSIITAAVERGGEIRAEVTNDTSTITKKEFLRENVTSKDTILITDGSKRKVNYANEYERHSVQHSAHEYVRESIYINTVEGFWSHFKRSMKGTHKSVSRKYLQSYLDGFVFHYNNRHNDSVRFSCLLGALLSAAR